MKLNDLLDRLEAAKLLVHRGDRFDNEFIDHLVYDSRKVEAGGLFVAIKGTQADGHLFIEKAVQNGAIAVVCEAMPVEAHTRFPGIAFAQVHDARAALAELSAAFYGDPARQLDMIGITGTNGKTTTAFLVHHLLTMLGQKTGLISTVSYKIGQNDIPATHTTPDALDTARMLRQMVDEGCGACVMEVSSHALEQERVRTIPYRTAVFTNLSQDHLDYHETMEAYFSAKKRLFDGLKPRSVAVYNRDDPAGEGMVADSRAEKLSYGLHPEADIRGEVLENALEGLMLSIEGSARRYNLVGGFNAYNLMAAYGVGKSLGYDGAEIVNELAAASPVPGRFERISVSRGRYVVVDYAHTPDALENVLRTARETRGDSSKLWCLMGCGGDRDASKRPVMGEIAERLADHVIVTSDNPRTEDPAGILDDIKIGFTAPDRAAWIVDRREAIKASADRSAPGDVILIAGKGHEPYQVVGTEKRPFDDREEAIKAFGLE